MYASSGGSRSKSSVASGSLTSDAQPERIMCNSRTTRRWRSVFNPILRDGRSCTAVALHAIWFRRFTIAQDGLPLPAPEEFAGEILQSGGAAWERDFSDFASRGHTGQRIPQPFAFRSCYPDGLEDIGIPFGVVHTHRDGAIGRGHHENASVHAFTLEPAGIHEVMDDKRQLIDAAPGGPEIRSGRPQGPA